MNFFNRKPKVTLDGFCHDFYDKNILHAVISGIDAGSLFLDTIRKSVAEVDPSFANVTSQLFEAEMSVLRFEVFGLAWLHQLGDKRAAEQSAFTKRYLEEQERPDIWEAMEPYNRAIARSSTHGVSPDTAAGRMRLTYINSVRMNMYELWEKRGFEGKCVARVVNRLLSEMAWKDGVTRSYLMLTLCDRLGCAVNEEAQFQLIATIIGLYKGAREALDDVKIKS